MVVRESLSGLFLDQALLHQPADGAASRSGITKGLPDRDQLRVALVQLVAEPPETGNDASGSEVIWTLVTWKVIGAMTSRQQ